MRTGIRMMTLLMAAVCAAALSAPAVALAVDTSPPVSRSEVTPWCAPTSFAFVANDEDGGSGIATLNCRIDGGAALTVVRPSTKSGPPITPYKESHSLIPLTHAGGADPGTGTSCPACHIVADAPPVGVGSPASSWDVPHSALGCFACHKKILGDVIPSGIGPIQDHLRLTVSPEIGSHTIEYWSTDLAGNEETHRTEPFTVTNTAPAALYSDAQAFYPEDAPVDIHVSAVATGWAGLVIMRCRVDGAAQDVTFSFGPVSSLDGTVHVAGSGIHVLEFWAEDYLGRQSVHKTVQFAIASTDRGPSSLTIARSRSALLLGQTVMLSGLASPNPGMVGATVSVYEKKPGKTYWSYSSRRVVASRNGAAFWAYPYRFKPGMARGIYYFQAGFVGDSRYLASRSGTVGIRVR
jgi:hypothetical protein